jgi:hypothetical protein
MICPVHLQSAFNALHKTKEDCKTKDRNRDPKCIPLRPVSPIIPELRYGSGFWLVESLPKTYEFFAPVIKVRSAAISGHHQFPIEEGNIWTCSVVVL